MKNWINFKELREKLKFEDVLRHYKVEVKPNKTQHTGHCPLPQHSGKQQSPSFSANLVKGIFQCFHCGASGNLLDFAVFMEKGDPNNPQDVRETALKLQNVFGMAKGTESNKPKEKPAPPPPPAGGRVIVNAPLDFELKTLDFKHPYLRNRRFTDETIQAFGLGFCSKGYHAGRIAIPLYDHGGHLIGYAGRIVDDALISQENPRYKFPTARVRKDATIEFRKSEFLYGGHLIKSPVDDLVVAEGFPTVWWFRQHRIAPVVGLMGWSMSEAQAKLVVSLVKPQGRVWLMSDGDESGEQCGESVLPQVSPYRFIRWVKLEQGKQPTDYQEARLRTLLNP